MPDSLENLDVDFNEEVKKIVDNYEDSILSDGDISEVIPSNDEIEHLMSPKIVSVQRKDAFNNYYDIRLKYIPIQANYEEETKKTQIKLKSYIETHDLSEDDKIRYIQKIVELPNELRKSSGLPVVGYETYDDIPQKDEIIKKAA